MSLMRFVAWAAEAVAVIPEAVPDIRAVAQVAPATVQAALEVAVRAAAERRDSCLL